jgi:hypothetical protein
VLLLVAQGAPLAEQADSAPFQAGEGAALRGEELILGAQRQHPRRELAPKRAPWRLLRQRDLLLDLRLQPGGARQEVLDLLVQRGERHRCAAARRRPRHSGARHRGGRFRVWSSSNSR